ncbi:class I SAM-dependent methyltransferase [bacterium AH-315-M05]|nr:class I SAM-dependent methyltransferase [bacterium AH-315-M05]
MKYLKSFIKSIIPKVLRPAILKIFYKLRTPFYIGNNVHCPCCNGNFRKFSSFTSYYKTRKNAQCPRCGSLERHRLLWLYLNNKTNLFTDNLKLLHFAPEIIFQKHFGKLSNIDYTSADLDSPLADVKMDIHNIIYDDDFFDVILCFHVLDHVKDDKQAMRELFRVLKYGGWAIIQSSIDINRDKTFEDSSAITPQDRLRIYAQSDLARKYGLDFKDRLAEAGFTVKADQYGKELNANLVNKYGISQDVSIYYCTKLEQKHV